jgi:hypothetical protein
MDSRRPSQLKRCAALTRASLPSFASLASSMRQINWKQRFFVPSDENNGIDILESLLERYPVMPTDDLVSGDESSIAGSPSQAEITATEIVDLDQWIVAVGKLNPENQTTDEIDRQVDAVEPETRTEEEPPFALTQEAALSWTFQAKRANAISFQLWLRGKTSPGKKTNPTGTCRVCRLQPPSAESPFRRRREVRHFMSRDRGHHLASDVRDFPRSINLGR